MLERMPPPIDDGAPTIPSRIAAAVFGVVLAGAGALAGFFAAVPMFRDWDTTALFIVVLFGPMSAVLLAAAWSMLVFAATGRRQRLLPPGPLLVLGLVLAVFLGVVATIAAIEGEWLAMLGALSAMAVGGSYAYRYWHATKNPPS